MHNYIGYFFQDNTTKNAPPTSQLSKKYPIK